MRQNGLMGYRAQAAEFEKRVKDGEDIRHKARIITYADLKNKKPKHISSPTNDIETEVEDTIAVYRKRWEIELPFSN